MPNRNSSQAPSERSKHSNGRYGSSTSPPSSGVSSSDSESAGSSSSGMESQKPLEPKGDKSRLVNGNQLSTPAVQPNQEWRFWPEVAVWINGLPANCRKTWNIWELCSQYGDVRYIRIENRQSGNAYVVFSTIPRIAFWERIVTVPTSFGQSRPLRILLQRPNNMKRCISPIDSSRSFPEQMFLSANALDFGFMNRKDEMVAMRSLQCDPAQPFQLVLVLNSERSKRLEIRFTISSRLTTISYRLQIPLHSIKQILGAKRPDQTRCLAITTKDPPKYFRQVERERVRNTHNPHSTEWKEWPKMWERQTDIDRVTQARNSLPVSLIRSDPLIDPGRWLTYKLDFPPSDHTTRFYSILCDALQDHNIRIETVPVLTIQPEMRSIVWEWLDPHRASHETDLHQMQHDLLHLDFEVRYQLEACISQHRINEFNITKEFVQRLSSMDKTSAQVLLENVADSKRMYNFPMDVFTASELRSSRKRRVPHGCVLMHSVTVTPTTFHVCTPTVEISNRVIRDNSAHTDRFLRVRYEDEDCYGRLWWSARDDNQEEVYNRIRRTFKNGIDIAGRHYEFLASGNSQFRENGAYFFSATGNVNAESIRSTLGNFDPINVVAKYAARVGQCFSTTRAITHINSIPVVKINDIKRNGFCFTDGVGKISPFIAQMIADQFRINTTPGDYPSVYQFRMGGCKGVLAVDPTIKGISVHIRPSQMKFEGKTEGLEVIRVSSFATSFLNQQIILVLSALGVPKTVFTKKMEEELRGINHAVSDENTALNLLQKTVDFNQATLGIASMILDGFMNVQEPFLMSLLQLWRAWSIKYLKEKAKITVDQGAFVLGCVDETNTLKMDAGQLPEIFIQIPDPEKKGAYKQIEAICVLARNPSLHPGDIRVVRAVRCEKLRHLKNVVVLPQRGDRDLANMCSGGDLDGDDYLVMWDQDILPPQEEWNHPPMDYTPPLPRMAIGKVTVEQINDFFVDYMKFDNLGNIAVNHRAMADASDSVGGVKSQKCLRLAQLHSEAVDFPKTGVPAKLDQDLFPNLWPHWMYNKPAKKQYKSKAVLGLLYDQVERVEFHGVYEAPFDSRILNAYELEPDMLAAAKSLKEEYDADMRRIMAQHGVKTEFEVWTAFVMGHNREKSDYSFAEEMGRLVTALKTQYQDLCLEKAGLKNLDRDFQKLGPFVAAMYTATAQESAAYHDNKLVDVVVGDTPSTLFISFPWIFAAELGQIAMKDQARRHLLAPSANAVNKQLKLKQMPGHTAADLAGISLEPLPEIQLPLPLPVLDSSGAKEGVIAPPSTSGDHLGIPAVNDNYAGSGSRTVQAEKAHDNTEAAPEEESDTADLIGAVGQAVSPSASPTIVGGVSGRTESVPESEPISDQSGASDGMENSETSVKKSNLDRLADLIGF